MSKPLNDGTHLKNAREIYVEQLAHGRGHMNKKRKTFTSLNPTDQNDFAYKSTPNYLRQIAQQKQNSLSPRDMITAQNVPRTRSASEVAAKNSVTRSLNGDPKYKDQEDYYAEIQSLKKDMKTMKEENSNLRAKIRRLEEDNTRKRKEIDSLYDPIKDGDLRRTLPGSLTDQHNNMNPTANVVMSLKQRLYKLELQLKQKENTIDELKSDPRWTKSTEFEIENRALHSELERQKAERLYNIQNDYDAALVDEQKNAIRKLTQLKDGFSKENKSLRRKVRELENKDLNQSLPEAESDDESYVKNSDVFKKLQRELDQYREKCEQLKDVERERDQFRDDVNPMKEKFEQIKRKYDDHKQKSAENDENLRKTQQNLEEIQKNYDKITKDLEATKRERDDHKEKIVQNDGNLKQIRQKQDQIQKKYEENTEQLEEIKRERDRYKKQLEEAKEELERERNKRSRSPIDVRPHSPMMERAAMPGRRTPSPPLTSLKRPESPIPSKSKPVPSRNGTPQKRTSIDDISTKPALNTIQASVKGHLNRSELDKNSNSPTSTSVTDGKIQSGEPKSSSKSNQPTTPPTKLHRSSSPHTDSKRKLFNNDNGTPDVNPRSSLTQPSLSKPRRPPASSEDSHPAISSRPGSQIKLKDDENDDGPVKDDQTSSAKLPGSKSQPADSPQNSSPHANKSSIPVKDRTHLGTANRSTKTGGDVSPKLPSTPHRSSPDNSQPSPGKNSMASKSPNKTPVKDDFDDDDDVVAVTGQ